MFLNGLGGGTLTYAVVSANDVSNVPVPASLPMAGAALAGMVAYSRRKRLA